MPQHGEYIHCSQSHLPTIFPEPKLAKNFLKLHRSIKSSESCPFFNHKKESYNLKNSLRFPTSTKLFDLPLMLTTKIEFPDNTRLPCPP